MGHIATRMGGAAHNACDLLSPRQVRYQAALYRDIGGSCRSWTCLAGLKARSTAAMPTTQKMVTMKNWWAALESNQDVSDYGSGALPVKPTAREC